MRNSPTEPEIEQYKTLIILYIEYTDTLPPRSLETADLLFTQNVIFSIELQNVSFERSIEMVERTGNWTVKFVVSLRKVGARKIAVQVRNSL